MSYMEDEERPSERAMREAAEERERERQEQYQREQAQREEYRAKNVIISEMRTALDRYQRVLSWPTETYRRPMDYSDAKYAEELEIVAWQIQGLGETMREQMPELFWPKGTPISIAGAVFYKTERLQAFKLDLEALIQSVDDVLLDTVDPEEDDDDA